MAQQWDGKSYDNDWNEIDAMGVRTGGKGGPGWQQQSTAVSTTAPTTPAPNADWQGLSDSVFGKVKGNIAETGVVDQNDPAYRQAITSNELQTNRAAQRAREASMQRRAATGTGTSGAVDTDVNKILENQAYQNQGFEANLLGQFRQQGLDRAAQGLQLGAGMLTAEQERALRGQLTREGYGLQRELGMEDIDYRRDALGQQLALSQADLDQQAMLALLRPPG